MMKKILLAALAAFTMVGTAHAVASSPVRIEYQTVKFRTNAAANPAPGFVDSTTTMRLGAAGASSVLDTTTVISTEGWLFDGPKVLADTSGFHCILYVYDAQGADDCQSGADSLAVAMQVSANGEDWATVAAVAGQTVSAATNPIGTRNNQTILNGAFMDRLTLNGASVANGKPVWMFKYKVRGAQQFNALSEGEVHGWPFIRFILSFHDAAGYKVGAKVAYLSGAVE